MKVWCSESPAFGKLQTVSSNPNDHYADNYKNTIQWNILNLTI